MKYPNIEAERARSGMTADELARALGVSRKTVYNWISNGRIPQSALEKMSDLFSCTIDYLLAQSILNRKRANYKADPQKHIDRQKAYYAENRDKVLARHKLYRQTHKEQIAKYNKAYREAHRDHILAQEKAYREKNRALLNEKQRARNRAKKEAASRTGPPESGKGNI